MEWFVKEGQTVKEMDKLCLVESDKAAVEITSRYQGTVTKLCFKQFELVKIGSVILEIDDGKDDSHNLKPSEHAEPAKPSQHSEPVKRSEHTEKSVSPKEEILAAPAVRQFAKQRNVSLSEVRGSGKNGRISIEDIETHLRETTERPNKAGMHSTILTGIPAAMARSMSNSVTVPQFSISEELHVDELLAQISEMKAEAKDKLSLQTITITAFLIKALSLCLLDFPHLNSKLRHNNGEYIVDIATDHNISIAIQAPQGLVVPNIKKVQDLSIADIQKELLSLMGKAHDGRLLPDDVQGGTISLSNIGVIGGTEARALLFDGQAVIGAICRIRELPRFSGDEIVKSKVMNITWTADHRHIDGATMARFSNRFKEVAEKPELMLLHLH